MDSSTLNPKRLQNLKKLGQLNFLKFMNLKVKAYNDTNLILFDMYNM